MGSSTVQYINRLRANFYILITAMFCISLGLDYSGGGWTWLAVPLWGAFAYALISEEKRMRADADIVKYIAS